MKQLSRHRKGLTLVEVLIVLAIIAVLATLAFPAWQSSRRGAAEAVTGARFRQIWMGFQLYSIDHQETMPWATLRLPEPYFSQQPDSFRNWILAYDVPDYRFVLQPYKVDASQWEVPWGRGTDIFRKQGWSAAPCYALRESTAQISPNRAAVAEIFTFLANGGHSSKAGDWILTIRHDGSLRKTPYEEATSIEFHGRPSWGVAP